MGDLSKVREAVKSVISALMAEEPFLGLMLKRTWIYADTETNAIAYADKLSIYLNPDKFNGLDSREQVFTLVHELMHIVKKHTLRSEEFMRRFSYVLDPVTMNILADAKVNQDLDKYRTFLKTLKPVFPDHVVKIFGLNGVEKKSLEELIEELAKKASKMGSQITINVGNPECCVFRPSGGGGRSDERRTGGDMVSEGNDNDRDIEAGGNKVRSGRKGSREVINEGDAEDRDAEERGSGDEMLRRWARKVVDSYVTAKSIGRISADLERVVEELLRPVIDWRRILYSALTKGIGRAVKRTWSRPSRKLPWIYPGKETLKINKVVVLVDTSGSIGAAELKRFISEIVGIVGETSKVVVIPWDARAYDPIEVRSIGDIERLRVQMRGGGGTVIYPALELLDKRYSDAAKIVIFSDWDVYDLNITETQNLLRKYASRIVAFTTHSKPPDFLESYKIEIIE
jgi:predicted metal-dependent peptidase